GQFDAASELINAVTSSLDPHTNYLPPADKANFDIRMSGSLEGIGALLRERDDYVEIVEIVPGGASWRQGILAPGDLILSVAAEDSATSTAANAATARSSSSSTASPPPPRRSSRAPSRTTTAPSSLAPGPPTAREPCRHSPIATGAPAARSTWASSRSPSSS